MIDTHTHLYMSDYAADGQTGMEGQTSAVDRAVEAGVGIMIMPNVDRGSVEPMKALHALRPDNTRMAMGLHPTEVKADWRDELGFLMSILDEGPSRFCAIGEVGIDLYWDSSMRLQQMEAFDLQLAKARSYDKPVIIHCRSGLDEALEVLEAYKGMRLVFHSFGGTQEDVARIRRDHDAYFGINGIVTFKNSNLSAALPAIGIDRILTETDAPFLSPVPHRGKRNESAYIPLIAARIASSLGLQPEDAEQLTETNARHFFNII